MTHLLKLTANKIEWLNQSGRKIVQNPQAKTTSKQPIFPFITQFSGQKLNNLPYFIYLFCEQIWSWSLCVLQLTKSTQILALILNNNNTNNTKFYLFIYAISMTFKATWKIWNMWLPN